MSKWAVSGLVTSAITMALALLSGSPPAAAAPSRDALELGDSDATTQAKLEKNVAIAKSAAKVFLELADKKPPKGHSDQQKEGWERQTSFFKTGSRQLDGLAAKGDALLAKVKSHKASLVEEMAKMNLQFLALQEATQMESRKYQTLSDASKARHDIAMNAIRNMK